MTDEDKAKEEAPLAPRLYRLVTIDGDTQLDVISTGNITFSELRNHVEEMAGVRLDPFHVVEVPEEGSPVERVCTTTEELAAAMTELTADEGSTLLVFRGERITVGQRRTVIPLTTETEEILTVPVSELDPPEETSPAGAAPEETPPAADAPAETPPAEG